MSGRLDSTRPYAIGLFRIVVALLFACHGASTLFGAFGGQSQPAGAWPGWYAAVIQLVGGLLVLVGLYTRPAALISSGSMAFAYFKVHQPHALLPIQNGGEPAAMFCWAMLLLVFTGSGAFGVDRLFTARGGTGEQMSAAEQEPVTA
ncbi:integral membrane protein [Streptomyces sulfonofaciens]|uniref:Integral membrane protein n=1 Tax=Streptomyces sulfonofaciens TaxID=68272 RepID=A0A919GHB2_9ACTN|nr:DoxX family protein [Streptomyces sulfonofaciens]GHH84411.1 integral membrane protein [Streptomyces sulfonofaciens]